MPVAFAVRKRLTAAASVRCGHKISCVRKVSFGVQEIRFTWQAQHFVDVRSLMCVLCGRCNELMTWACSLTVFVACAAFQVHFWTVSLRNHDEIAQSIQNCGNTKH